MAIVKMLDLIFGDTFTAIHIPVIIPQVAEKYF